MSPIPHEDGSKSLEPHSLEVHDPIELNRSTSIYSSNPFISAHNISTLKSANSTKNTNPEPHSKSTKSSMTFLPGIDTEKRAHHHGHPRPVTDLAEEVTASLEMMSNPALFDRPGSLGQSNKSDRIQLSAPGKKGNTGINFSGSKPEASANVAPITPESRRGSTLPPFIASEVTTWVWRCRIFVWAVSVLGGFVICIWATVLADSRNLLRP
jgi:hypothetical protein